MKLKRRKLTAAPRKKLTLKKERFVKFFVEDPARDPIRAYRLAGYKGNNGTEKYLAERVLNQPEVQEAIKKQTAFEENQELSVIENKLVMYYMESGNQQAAARKAGYAEKSVNTIYTVFGKPKIQEAIKLRQKEWMQRQQVSIDRNLKEEICIAYSDLGSVFENGRLKKIEDIEEKTRRAISSYTENEFFDKDGNHLKTNRKITFWDKGKSLERLGKHMSMYTENLNMNLKGEINTVNKTLVVIPKPLETMEDWQKLADSYHGVETDE